jgi:RimJ/RimL family protein N-acetyltransferase
VSHRFRPAAARDRDAVLAFCARSSPSGDYLPLVWDDWLVDPGGAFVAGIDQGDQAIAVVKLVVAAPGEGWLQGVRVAPERRERGLGRALVRHVTDCAWRQGLDTLRFVTDAGNAPMHRVAAACGFAVRGEYRPFRADAGDATRAPLDGGSASAAIAVRPAQPDEVPALCAAVEAVYAAAEPIRWWGWTGAAFDLAWLARAVAMGHVLVAADDRSFVVLTPPDPTLRAAKYGRPPEAEVAFLAATAAACPALLAAARRWAAAVGSEQVFGLLPPVATIAAEAGGWVSRSERPFLLYRRDRPADLHAHA